MVESEGKPRILIVEDHPIIAELVETRLRIEGMDPVKHWRSSERRRSTPSSSTS
jgi:DNA-binding response OmpR family regulator